MRLRRGDVSTQDNLATDILGFAAIPALRRRVAFPCNAFKEFALVW